MGNQMTEMLKGTLEGIVLAVLAVQPAYGYEITARLREQGFSDLVEGTVYALLVRIEQFLDARVCALKVAPWANGTILRHLAGDLVARLTWRRGSMLKPYRESRLPLRA